MITILSFLLLSVPGIVVTGFIYNKKADQISLIRIVIWILWIIVLFSLSGLVISRFTNLPYGFAAVIVSAMLFGILYMWLAPITLDWWERSETLSILAWNVALLFFGMAGFSITYAMMSGHEPNTSVFLVGNLAFLLPALLVKSYDFWMAIPSKKYKTWPFPVHAPIPKLQPIDPIKLTMNFTPVPSGKNGPFEGYEVELPSNETLGELFHYFISFHNKHREYKKRPIQFLEGDVPLEWVLFKYTPQKKKLYLDMDKTLVENQVGPNEHIYALSSS